MNNPVIVNATGAPVMCYLYNFGDKVNLISRDKKQLAVDESWYLSIPDESIEVGYSDMNGMVKVKGDPWVFRGGEQDVAALVSQPPSLGVLESDAVACYFYKLGFQNHDGLNHTTEEDQLKSLLNLSLLIFEGLLVAVSQAGPAYAIEVMRQSLQESATSVPSIGQITAALGALIAESEARQYAAAIQYADYVMRQRILSTDVGNADDKVRLLKEVRDLIAPDSNFGVALYGLRSNPALATISLPSLLIGVALWCELKYIDLASEHAAGGLTSAKINVAKREAADFSGAIEAAKRSVMQKGLSVLGSLPVRAGHTRDVVRDGFIAKYYWGNEAASERSIQAIDNYCKSLDRIAST